MPDEAQLIDRKANFIRGVIYRHESELVICKQYGATERRVQHVHPIAPENHSQSLSLLHRSQPFSHLEDHCQSLNPGARLSRFRAGKAT